jgi:hypothetical protein
MIRVHVAPGEDLVKLSIENGKKLLISAIFPRSELAEKFHTPLEGQTVDEELEIVVGVGSLRRTYKATDVYIIRISPGDTPGCTVMTMQCETLTCAVTCPSMW